MNGLSVKFFASFAAEIGAAAAKERIVPRSVNSTSDLCCTLHEWLVSSPRGSTEC
jgi:hypothetical protein